MKKKKLLVIFGGRSMEYYAACKSVAGVVDYIDRELFEVLQIGVTYDGEWFLTKATSEEIYDGESWKKRSDNKPAIVSPVRDAGEIIILDGEEVKKESIDVIFPLICGYSGEDGRLQGLLDLSNIPYVGSGVAASANSMDKEYTRHFADACGLKQPACVIVHKDNFNIDDVDRQITFGYPVFVKPATGGTSVGVGLASNKEELEKALIESFKFDDKALIEEEIKGTEIKISVLEEEKGLTIGAICEIFIEEGVVNDYETKQTKSSVKKIPAELDPDVEAELIRQAKAVFTELGCKGFARVDFFLTPEKEIVFNEINTVPGLGKGFIYSVMFEKTGMEFTDLLTKLINSAFLK